MLTLEGLIGVISLVLTAFGVGYAIGKDRDGSNSESVEILSAAAIASVIIQAQSPQKNPRHHPGYSFACLCFPRIQHLVWPASCFFL